MNYEKEEGGWSGQLGELLRYFGGKHDYYCTHTADWEHELYHTDVQPYHNINAPFNRCSLTVSRWPVSRNPLDLRNRGNRKPVGLNYFYTNFLTGPFVSTVELPLGDSIDTTGIEIWNVGIINGSNWKEEKINALETVYARIYLQNEKTDKTVILGGDFNAPLKELSKQDSDADEIEIIPHDGNDYQATNRPFYGNPYRYRDSEERSAEFSFAQRWRNAERYIFDPEFSDWKMRDAYWIADDSAKESSTTDYTHVVNNGNPANKRLDHVLTSDRIDVKSCDIQNGEHDSANGFDASDHAPVVAELEIS